MLPTFITSWVSAHVALLTTIWVYGTTAALAFSWLWKRVDPLVRARFPRVEHAVNALVAGFTAIVPFLKSLWGVVVGTPIPTVPTFTTLDTRASIAPGAPTGVRSGTLAALLALALTGCTVTPTPVDGGPVVTPSGWVSTVTTVDTALTWVLPSADALIDGLVAPSAAPAVHGAFRVAEGTVAALQSALNAYLTTSNGGTMCQARAAIGAVATGLEGIATALVPVGVGVAPEIASAVQALAAVADELAPACPLPGGGLPPSGVAAAHAVNSAAVLRPFPALTPPAGVVR